jgi:hypothetical protein
MWTNDVSYREGCVYMAGHACGRRRILRCWSAFELDQATKARNLPALKRALARAAELREETPEVAAAELQQAELESLVREYDAGNERSFDKDVLPWTVEQLVNTVRAALYKTAIGQDLMRLISRWDTDGTGEITYEEFVVALREQVKIPAKTIPDHYIKKLYNHIDSDGSGLIDSEELISFLRKGSSHSMNHQIAAVSDFTSNSVKLLYLDHSRKSSNPQLR